MSQRIRTVIVAGASGTIGAPILAGLLASKLFKVSVLSRPESKATFPSGVDVKRVDPEDNAGLVEALKGQDALISTVSGKVSSLQIPLLEAAIEAGVKRIIPSEWAFHAMRSANQELDDLVAPGRPVVEFLKQKGREAEAQGKDFHWTGVDPGIFFDCCLKTGFMGIAVIPERKATIWDNGDTRFSATNIPTIVTAVVQILTTADAETRNRFVTIESFATTQNEIIATLEAVSGKSWDVTRKTTEEQLRTANALAATGQWMPSFSIKIMTLIYEPGSGADLSVYSKLDNELLGLPKENIRDAVESVLREFK
ncbi:Pinoresinol reductase 1-like protein 3 [Phlyctema vagabunda]|uniref:Pinoresinol reductase 1-like protein 3 n=1 Tax=Phlyctema vagabunda TaxID=108571 RepID=A0ABR4P974_9HELO